MTRTIIWNTKNECIGWFGDTINELGYLVKFIENKKEVSRTSTRKNSTNYINIIVEV